MGVSHNNQYDQNKQQYKSSSSTYFSPTRISQFEMTATKKSFRSFSQSPSKLAGSLIEPNVLWIKSTFNLLFFTPAWYSPSFSYTPL